MSVGARVLTIASNTTYGSIAESAREHIALVEDHSSGVRVLKLYVNKSRMFDPFVSSLESRLKRKCEEYEIVPVALEKIKEFYALEQRHSTSANVQVASQLQDYVKQLFSAAVRAHASDIHIRVSKRTGTLVLMRIHNDLVKHSEESEEFGTLLLRGIYQSMTSTSDSTFEQNSRQDARISDQKHLPPGLDGIRIATAPTTEGNLMVMRLLHHDSSNSVDLTKLGYSPEQMRAIERMKQMPTGINILGGPTGSGKSTTLQKVLRGIGEESKGRKHIITVEDPPEYPIPNTCQTPVANANTEQERSAAFQAAIKSAMRLDPDIIMIGEMRDAPSANLALQAAMTGHQVWTTVHANHALAIIDRLTNLHVPIELLTDPSIITGLVCQRLLKVVCPHCAIPLVAPGAKERVGEELFNRVIAVADIARVMITGDGCEHCHHTGTKGRTVVAEVVVTDQMLMDLIRAGKRKEAIHYWKHEQGNITMLQHAIQKVEAGLCDPVAAEAVVGPLVMSEINKQRGGFSPVYDASSGED